MALKCYLVRHGETYFNNSGRIQGWMDVGLNEEGRTQVKQLSEHFPSDNSLTIASSPLRRARESAEILRDQLNIEKINIIEEFRELNQGHWNGLRDEIVTDVQPETFRNWNEQPVSTSPPAGESLEDVKRRVEEGLDRVVDMMSPPVLIVAHKVVNSILFHLAGECEFNEVMNSLPDNAAVFEIQVSGTESETGESS